MPQVQRQHVNQTTQQLHKITKLNWTTERIQRKQNSCYIISQATRKKTRYRPQLWKMYFDRQVECDLIILMSKQARWVHQCSNKTKSRTSLPRILYFHGASSVQKLSGHSTVLSNFLEVCKSNPNILCLCVVSGAMMENVWRFTMRPFFFMCTLVLFQETLQKCYEDHSYCVHLYCLKKHCRHFTEILLLVYTCNVSGTIAEVSGRH